MLILLPVMALVAGCGDIGFGSTGQDTSFERVGAAACPEIGTTTQVQVVGDASNPVRCGPQAQPLP